MSGQQHVPAAIYPRERPAKHCTGSWASRPVWTGRKPRPHRDSIPNPPARSQSLYRLSYPAHKFIINVGKITNKRNVMLQKAVICYNKPVFVCLFVFGATAPKLGQGLLIHEVSRSHTTTHHSRQDSSRRVISASQRLLLDNTQQSQQTDIHAPGGIRTHNLSRRAATDLRLRRRGHWDLHNKPVQTLNHKVL